MRPDERPIGFRRHPRAESIRGEAADLVSHRGPTALCGAAIEKAAPLLDGSPPVDRHGRKYLTRTVVTLNARNRIDAVRVATEACRLP
jgi:hypothetical protein